MDSRTLGKLLVNDRKDKRKNLSVTTTFSAKCWFAANAAAVSNWATIKILLLRRYGRGYAWLCSAHFSMQSSQGLGSYMIRYDMIMIWYEWLNNINIYLKSNKERLSIGL